VCVDGLKEIDTESPDFYFILAFQKFIHLVRLFFQNFPWMQYRARKVIGENGNTLDVMLLGRQQT
jgi:hypothetical protein